MVGGRPDKRFDYSMLKNNVKFRKQIADIIYFSQDLQPLLILAMIARGTPRDLHVFHMLKQFSCTPSCGATFEPFSAECRSSRASALSEKFTFSSEYERHTIIEPLRSQI